MAKATAATHVLCVAGDEVRLQLRRDSRARCMKLSLDAQAEIFRLTLPEGIAAKRGLAFAESHGHWMRRKLSGLPPRIPFDAGRVIPLLGLEHLICHLPLARRGVWAEEGAIRVSGRLEHVPRRVADFLKAEARREIGQRARDKAARLGQAFKGICVRDTTSRWGSCSAAGTLSFSWRLVLAPEHVLDYVVAHEVAHLAEFNHSKRFWEATAGLTEEIEPARSWLRRHGDGLLRYG